jgi:N,N'-diacetyllegionaminate synthase
MKFAQRVNIGPLTVSAGAPAVVIAEAGVNHNGRMELARKLVDAAVAAGADAVKFQAFRTEALILASVRKASYQIKNSKTEESQFAMLKKLELTRAQNKELKDYCRKKRIIFLTTPFDEQSLDELDELDLPAYKIASTDITNLLFLRKVARKNKPVILSTGMATIEDVEAALRAIYPLNKNVVLLQCSANYPVADHEVNLRVMRVYRERFNILAGYSDHTVGLGASPYAVAAGAKVIEKHFTLDKGSDGPDHKASLDPRELKELVEEIRKVESYLGSETKALTASEKANRKSLQKCLVAARTIKKGELFSVGNIIGKRTGGVGISAIDYQKLIGKKALKDYETDHIIKI